MPKSTLKAWQIIPETPSLPKTGKMGYVPINKANIWYAEYGTGSSVVLLHGGLVNSNYWGKLVSVLQKKYHVIVIDSRWHGRSTLGTTKLSYSLMANDVLHVLDFLNVKSAAIIGWSDGANIGLEIAIHHPDRITKLFALGGNSSPDATLDVTESPSFDSFSKRIEKEYLVLSPTPSLDNFRILCKLVEKMWVTEPSFSTEMLKKISAPTWIVTGDHDEAIKRSNSEFMAATIPSAGLLIEPNAGHFVFLQYPGKFNDDVLHFLE